MCPAFPRALLGQADNQRRLVVHHDDSGARSCAYPCTTLLGGIRWWIQRDRLSRPLHNIDSQSQSWGVCIILASRREESHLYSFQVIKDLTVSTPHPWLQRHFEGTDRRDPLNMGSRTAYSTPAESGRLKTPTSYTSCMPLYQTCGLSFLQIT